MLDQLQNLTESERQAALEILKQFSEGKQDLYQDLLFADWDEIPVDITTFIHDKRYLGNALYDQEGRFTLFPYWEEKLKEIFPDNFTTKYNTLVLTGSIGIGKTFVACVCLLYLLYRLLCLKDPYLYYGLQPIDKISISLMNITLDNARGVALDKMNQMILSSDWFMSHGKMSGTSNLNYIPEKHIEVITASSNNQVIGRAVFCLEGDTLIETSEGTYSLQELSGQQVKLLSVDMKGNLSCSEGIVCLSTSTTEEYQVELEDGSTIKCTYGHRFKLKDGSYKEVQNLTVEDELYDVSEYDIFIDHIIQTRGQWGLESHYEGHHILPKCLGGKGRAKSKHPNIIRLTPAEHFTAHKLLLKKYPENQQLKFAFSRMVYQRGYQKELTAEEYDFLKQEYREFLSYREVSQETRQCMSKAQKERYKTQSGTIKGKKAINNGQICCYIDKDKRIPEGFVRGNLTSGKRPKHTVHKPHVIKDPEAYRLQKHLQMAGSNNNMYGKGYKVSGGRNGHALYDYYYKGQYFDCRRSLVKYLRESVDAQVSESTLRRWEKSKSERLLKAHSCLSKIEWRLKGED